MTIKIFFLLMIFSSPNLPSVKYNAMIYPTENDCLVAKQGYLSSYAAKPPEYKELVITEAYCIPFNSFPIKGMHDNVKGTSA